METDTPRMLNVWLNLQHLSNILGSRVMQFEGMCWHRSQVHKFFCCSVSTLQVSLNTRGMTAALTVYKDQF